MLFLQPIVMVSRNTRDVYAILQTDMLTAEVYRSRAAVIKAAEEKFNCRVSWIFPTSAYTPQRAQE